MPKHQILALATQLDRDLRVIRQILRRPVEAQVAKAGLTAPQQSAMRALINSEGLSLKNLSKELRLAHSTASGIIDRLEKQGLVRRQADPSDLRLSKIVVSGQVRAYWRKVRPVLKMHPLAEALDAATSKERQETLRGVRTLRRLLERRNGGRTVPPPEGKS